MAKKIRCEWADKKRFVINPDGQVWPCCYFANLDYYVKNEENIPGGHEKQIAHSLYKDYDENREEYNAFNCPAHKILQKEWFTKILPESWELDEDDRHFLCIKHCEIEK
jgi:hypothetical protein